MTTIAVPSQRSSSKSGGYAVTVRRARRALVLLLGAIIMAGIVTTIIGILAVQDTLGSYRSIVDDSSRSADAAQAAREALLGHHSAAAEFLSQPDNRAASDALRRSDQAWLEYQEAIRRLWQNRSDREFGEFAVFAATDRATWRYRSSIDAMRAFAGTGDNERAHEAFNQSHQLLVRELVPALNGMESMKLERMEETYAVTDAAISRWQTILLFVGGYTMLLLLFAFLLTRFWLHYAWTWELVLALLLGFALFAWFNASLIYAASEVKVMVRDAYDTVSGVQSIEALLTQADALESMAIFAPERAPEMLRDADQYLFLLEQQLCGELACTDESFLRNNLIRGEIINRAQTGHEKYGLSRAPLIIRANERGTGGPAVLEQLRRAIAEYRQANSRLKQDLAGGTASEEQRQRSEAAYQAALEAAKQEQRLARREFDDIYFNVTDAMQVNRWLALLFTGAALLGFWGLRRRREALFV